MYILRCDLNIRKNNYYIFTLACKVQKERKKKRNKKRIISNIPVGRSSKEAFARLLLFCIFIPSLDKLAVGIPRSVLPLPNPLTTIEISRRGKLPSTNNCSSSMSLFVVLVVMTNMMVHCRFYDPSFPGFCQSFSFQEIFLSTMMWKYGKKIDRRSK